jgi:hypothetical protein
MTTETDAPPRTVGVGVLWGLSVVWLVFQLWSAGATISTSEDLSVAASTIVQILPTIIGACLLFGATSGLLASSRLSLPFLRGRSDSVRRGVTGGAAGLIGGALVGLVVLLDFGTPGSIVAIAVTLAVAGLLGGATAALPPVRLAACLAAVLAFLVTSVVTSLFQHPLKTALGGDASISAQISAGNWVSIAQALVEGIVAALTAFTYLRRRGDGSSWPWYLLAGAAPGLMSLAATGLTQVGGASLYRLVGNLSVLDDVYLSYIVTAGSVRSGLILAFVGGIGAMIAIGRTLGRPVSS